MVARNIMRMGLCLAMFLALAAVWGGVGQSPVAAQGRPTRAHQALARGIEYARQGEYEHALNFFEQAKAGIDNLNATEQRELQTQLANAQMALHQSREGTLQLRKAEQALQAKRTQEALAHLKELAGNQFLRPDDKRKVQQLMEQIQPATANVAGPQIGAANPQELAQARAKLRQARVFLSKEDYDGAEVMAKEAMKLNAGFSPVEDTPQKVLEEIAQARVAKMSAKELLTAARAALKRGDLEQADQLAQEAKKAESFWTVRLWGDSPAKVQKDVQAARARQVAAAKAAPPAITAAKLDLPKVDQPKSDFAKLTQPKTTETVKTSETPKAAAPGNDNTEDARAVVRQGRRALDEGRPEEALDLGRKAAKMNGAFHWWDVDNPSKLMADAHKARASASKAPAIAKTPSPADKAEPAQAAKTTPEPAKVDPRTQLKLARGYYGEGKLEEARELCQKAQLSGTSWGLFEDTPSKLMSDISKAQAKNDKEESIRLLAEAHKLFADGKHDEAEKLTYRAEKLHGPYSVWDFSERPNKLRGEIELARAKMRKTTVPPVPEAIAQRNLPPIETVPIETVPITPPATVAKGHTPPAATAQRTMVSNPDRDPPVAVRPSTSPLAKGGATPLTQGTPVAAVTPVPAMRPEATSAEKQRALNLLADARKDMEQGRLLDARQKALDAQKFGLTFNIDEERPERLLLELSAACNRQVDTLLQQATDVAASAGNDASKVRKAEEDLAAARQLASGFGQDTQSIDNKIAWLKSQQAVAQTMTPAVVPSAIPPTAVPAMPATINPVPPVAAVQHQEGSRGHQLLESARLELRKGELNVARRLAEEAFSGPYGVQQDAARVLSTLDAEEENQRILTANRTFELMQEAFRQKDLPRARLLAKSVDSVRLSPENKARHRDIMQSSSMQETQAVAQAPATTPNEKTGQRTTSGKTFQDEVAGMQEIEFQRLRTESAKARQEATRLFPTAPNRAVEILQSCKANLETSNLEQDYIVLLKRQIDSQLQQFQTLKAQVEFRDLQNQQAKSTLERRSKDAVAEQEKNQQVADLMRQYNGFRKQGKYREAEMMAMKARELDPDNAVIDAAIYTARTLRNQAEFDKSRMSGQEYMTGGLNDAENRGDYVNSSDPVKFDKERSARARSRGMNDFESLRNAKDRKIEERLNQPIPSIEFREGTPLNQVIEDIRALSGLNIVIDTGALQHEGIDPKQVMTVEPLEGIALKSALNIILAKATPTKLTHIIKDEVLMITTEREARGKLKSKTYQVADVIIPVDNYIVPPEASLMHQIRRGGGDRVTGSSSTFNGPNSLQGGMPTGMSSSGSGVPGLGSAEQAPVTGNPTASTRAPGQTNTMEEMLIKLITNTIAPNTWASVGGPGTIEYFPLGMALIINQTPDVQEQIGDLLDALRRLQDLEVSVEVRMISLEESFFERIGLDFDINIDPKVSPSVQSQIVTQQFAPINQVNYPRFQNVIAGLQPAASGGAGQGLGALTSDLHVPLQSSSFQYAIPPFGGFPGIPGANGGLSMGLAFLSDIQVFMFMEAAQGDRRTNVMQAPKLTLFNGQTATIQIQDFQWFVTNVQVVQSSGQTVFVPQNQPIPLGVNLAVQAVVSADRRFVRLNLSPTLTNLASATVPLFPITTFITPVFEGGAQGQPVPFTQFIQQPTFTLVTIQTTVSVPDGGTVLLGGLKLLNEGRNEFGPPILSKIPYLSRLWKNVGYGRDTSSLLIMVTPRIIINEEEEELQTGVRGDAFE